MKLKGLTTSEVKESRRLYGANVQKSARKNSIRIALDVVQEPMVILLLVTCFFYFFMGENQEGIIMLVAIVIVAGISVLQQARSESAIKTLNKLTKDPVTVIRNGEEVQIEADELVKGDVMQVSEGEVINGDAEILEANDFFVDESLLTGESVAVDKSKVMSAIFSGTIVSSGMAKALVTAVGSQTKLGRLGKIIDETQKEASPLQKQVNSFVKKMTLFGIGAFLLVWGFNFSLTGDVLDSLLRGLTLAMAVLPEEIPVAMATFMALGAYRLIKRNVLTRHPQTVEALGAATVICLDKTGTITENKMNVSGYYDFKSDTSQYLNNNYETDSSKELLFISMLASEESPFDPMEIAIHEKYIHVFKEPSNLKKIHEYPLSGKHPMMTHIYADKNGENIVACKGAPEGLIALSGLTETEKNKIQAHLTEFAKKGNRVLAVAKGIFSGDTFPDDQHSFKFEFLGLIALSDPPKKEMKEVISRFYEAGIDIKMITGDYPATAMSIASQINLRNAESCITGDEINSLSGEKLNNAIKKYTVYARVMPEVKLKIITALKNIGEIVAMTGDGVNDGPALKAAHIGVAMGKRGSAIARNASSLVLLKDDLNSMVSAITFGRNIYSNLKKAIQYIISIHIPLISIVTLPLLLGWKFPHLFSPVHVIFLELVMGPTCSIVYENEPIQKGLNKLIPRKITDSLFTWSELSRAVFQGIVISLVLLGFTFFLIAEGNSEIYTRTMLFTSLVFANIILTLTGRSTTESILKTIRYKNRLIPIIIFITMAVLFISLLIPAAQDIFVFTDLSFMDIGFCFAVGLSSVIWIEVWKYFRGSELNNRS